MNRTNQNFIVDLISFVLFTFLGVTGLLIHYILPAGSGHFKEVLGLNRHQWGDIHFTIAIAFLLVLATHVVLHWNWVVCVIKGRVKENIKWRVAAVITLLTVLLTLTLMILLSPVK